MNSERIEAQNLGHRKYKLVFSNENLSIIISNEGYIQCQQTTSTKLHLSTESICINKDYQQDHSNQKKEHTKMLNSWDRVFDHLVQNHGPRHSYITATLVSI